VSDLFGADLPVEGGDGGQFAWRDGPFLQALKAGHWILLDEVNVCLHMHCFDLHVFTFIC
jgi:midasin